MYRFSVLFNFMSSGNIFRPRFMNVVRSICYQKNILPASLLASILYVYLLYSLEQMFPGHYWIILMHKMGNQKKKIGKLISGTSKLYLNSSKCQYSQSFFIPVLNLE